MICNFHTCTVCQCEENEIPLPWKQDSEGDDVDKKIEEKFSAENEQVFGKELD